MPQCSSGLQDQLEALDGALVLVTHALLSSNRSPAGYVEVVRGKRAVRRQLRCAIPLQKKAMSEARTEDATPPGFQGALRRELEWLGGPAGSTEAESTDPTVEAMREAPTAGQGHSAQAAAAGDSASGDHGRERVDRRTGGTRLLREFSYGLPARKTGWESSARTAQQIHFLDLDRSAGGMAEGGKLGTCSSRAAAYFRPTGRGSGRCRCLTGK